MLEDVVQVRSPYLTLMGSFVVLALQRRGAVGCRVWTGVVYPVALPPEGESIQPAEFADRTTVIFATATDARRDYKGSRHEALLEEALATAMWLSKPSPDRSLEPL